MPFPDLPFRREARAPRFDPDDPNSIWRYFEDLDLLFIRHQVSDDSEKKRASVNYPDIETARLWQTTLTFGDPARAYDDFKAEVIRLYPEVSATRKYTILSLQRLVSDRARTEISSVQELGEYYREFRRVSHHLVETGRIGILEQSRHFLDSFEPRLASDIRARLEVKLLDHCPLDPYKIEDIFEAASYTLQVRTRAPFLPPSRDLASPSTSRQDASSSSQAPPPAAPAFPPTLEHLSPIEVAPVPPAQAREDQYHAPPSSTARGDFLPRMPALASSLPAKQVPHEVEAFLFSQACTQADPASKTSKSASQANASLVHAPRHETPPSTPARTSRPPSPVVPASISQFPHSPQSLQVAQQSADLPSTVPAFHHPASFVPPPRHELPPHIPAQTSTASPRIVPASFSRFPRVTQASQVAHRWTASLSNAPASQHHAPFVSSPRRDPSRLPAAPTPAPPVWTPPRAPDASQHTQTTTSPAPTNAATSKIDTLSHAVEALKASLQAILAGQETVEDRETAPRTWQKKTALCKFCGKPGHLIKECKKADEYTRTGKCKRDASGRIVLPSGAEVPRSVNCKTLHEHFEEWHRRNPTQKAARLAREVASTRTARPPPRVASQPYWRPAAQRADQQSALQHTRTYAMEQATLQSPGPRIINSGQPPTRVRTAVPEAACTATPGSVDLEPTKREPAAYRPGPAEKTAAKVPEPQGTKAVRASTKQSPVTVAQDESRFPSPEALMREAEASTPKTRRREEALAARMPAAFAFAARVPPAADTVTPGPYTVYLCERATNASPAEPGTKGTAEPNTQEAPVSIPDDQDVPGTSPNHQPTPDQRARNQMVPDSARAEASTTDLGGPPGSLGADFTTSDAFTRSAGPRVQDFDAASPVSDIAQMSPPPFRFIAAPCQSTLRLSFLGARTPLTVVSGQNHRPTTFRVPPAEPGARVQSTPPTASVSHFQPAPVNLSSPPPSKVVGRDPDEFSETTKRVPNRGAARQDPRVQEARERAVRAARALAQNHAVLAQELKVKAPVSVHDTASEKASNLKTRLQFGPKTTSTRRGEPPRPGRRIDARASPNIASSKEHSTRTRMPRA